VQGSGSGQGEAYQLQFLTAEERSTAILMGYFEDARLELENFIRTGDLSLSDATYYRQLLDETNRIATKVNAQGATWTSSVIPEGYSAGWRTHSPIVVNQGALEALSKSTLDLITQTSTGIRQAVRQTIAQGILQGLPADQVRQRIIATGMTNIPHWPTVEYRAGVIARTETMRAYNAGATDGMVANGARFAEWIASPDEATCQICLPREGKIYRIGNVVDDVPNDPYPGAQPLPHIPAHPRCRCTTRAVYRGPDGKVISATAQPEEPKLPTDAMGGQDPPTLPPAAGDLRKTLGQTKISEQEWRDYHLTDRDILNPGTGQPNEGLVFNRDAARAKIDPLRTLWRGMGRLDDDAIRAISAFGKTAKAQNELFDTVLQLRYGIKQTSSRGWSPELRRVTLSALERLREKWPRYVVDSPFLHTINAGAPTGQKMSSNAIAAAWPSGHIGVNMSHIGKYLNGQTLRAGAEVNAAEEVMLHEMMHTIHNRYGLSETIRHIGDYRNPTRTTLYGALEANAAEVAAEYRAIMRGTQKVVVGAFNDPVETILNRVTSYEKLRVDRVQQLEFAKARGDSQQIWYYESKIKELDTLIAKIKVEAEQVRVAIDAGGDFYPTEYAKSGGYAEDFAESAMLYFLNPEHLRRTSPARYEFFRTRIFVE
jgi:SPP1 gp7 family putative phage head morphogenesis protein